MNGLRDAQTVCAAPATCGHCRETLARSAVSRCLCCHTSYHHACFDEAGGCATRGCTAEARTPARAEPVGDAFGLSQRGLLLLGTICALPLTLTILDWTGGLLTIGVALSFWLALEDRLAFEARVAAVA